MLLRSFFGPRLLPPNSSILYKNMQKSYDKVLLLLQKLANRPVSFSGKCRNALQTALERNISGAMSVRSRNRLLLTDLQTFTFRISTSGVLPWPFIAWVNDLYVDVYFPMYLLFLP